MWGLWARRGALAAATIALAACGGGTAKHGEAAKPPAQIVDDVAAASRSLHTFRLDGIGTDAQGSLRLTAVVAGPGRIHLAVRRPSGAYDVIALGQEIYLNATRSYYAALPGLTPDQVARFANRWVKLPTADDAEVQASVTRATNIALQTRCWAARKKGLSIAGTGSVHGRAAVIVASDGSAPGSAPGKVYVATSGPAWPLRSIRTGPRKPGGVGACASASTATTSDITLSELNEPIHLAPPTNALDLSTAGR